MCGGVCVGVYYVCCGCVVVVRGCVSVYVCACVCMRTRLVFVRIVRVCCVYVVCVCVCAWVRVGVCVYVPGGREAIDENEMCVCVCVCVCVQTLLWESLSSSRQSMLHTLHLTALASRVSISL